MSTRLTSFRSFSQGTYGRTYNSCSVGNGSHQGGGSSSRIANYNKMYPMVGATTNTCTLNNTNYPNYLTNGIIFNNENYNGPSGYTLTQSATLGNCIYNVQQYYYLLIPQGIQLTINNGSTITTSSGQGYFSNVGTINGTNTWTINITELVGNPNVSVQYVNGIIPYYTLSLNSYITSLSNTATNTNYAYITIVINADTLLSASDSTIPANVTFQISGSGYSSGITLGINNNITNNGSIQVGDGPNQGGNYNGILVPYNNIIQNPTFYTITNNNLIYTFGNGQSPSNNITNSGIYVP
jgi:hypothetical protein